MNATVSPPLSSRLAWLLAVVAVVCAVPSGALAQTPTATTGVVSGTITDTTGGVLPGATVELRDVGTNTARNTLSDSRGHYSFAGVQPGRYSLSASLPGFSSAVVPEVGVEVNKSFTFDLKLSVGDITETVEVSAVVPLQRTDATVGNTMSSQTVLRLPSTNREITSIQFNQPLAVPYGGADSNRTRAGSVAGARTDQNTYILDGADVSDNLVGDGFLEALPSALVPLPSESVEEFSVASTNANATFGRGSGAQFVIVTKRGTNRFRGSGYFYLQDDALNANTWDRNRLGVDKPPLEDRRGGFSLGGPIFRDKTFFFANYEGRRLPRSSQVSRTVPTATAKAGILRFRDATGSVVNYDVRQLDPRAIGLNPVVADLWGKLPAGNDPSRGDGLNTTGFTGDAETKFDTDVLVGRVDHNLSNNWRIDANYRYGSLRETGAAQADIGGILGGQVGQPVATEDLPRQPRFFAAGLIGQLTPRFLNETRFSALKGHLAFRRVSPSSQAAGANIAFDIAEFDEPLNVDQTNSRTQVSDSWTYQAINNSTLVAGNHTLLFGGTFRHEDWAFTRTEQLGGSLTSPVAQITQGTNVRIPASALPPTCGGAVTTNCLLSADVARFSRMYAGLLGLVDRVSVLGARAGDLSPLPLGTEQDIDTSTNGWEFYANDTWRLAPSLSLTLGASYQWTTSPKEKDDRWAYLIDNATGETFSSDTYLARARAAAEAGLPYAPQLAFLPLSSSGREDYFDTDRSNFGPRAALAWSPSFSEGFLGGLLGVEKSVIRGGYALAFDRTNSVRSILSMGMAFGENLNVLAPRCTASNAPGAGCNPTSGNDLTAALRVGVDGAIPLPNHPAVSSPIVPSNLTITTFADSDINTGRTHSFNLTFQRQLPWNMTVETGWVRRLGRELSQAWVLSSVPYFFPDRASGQTFAQAYDAVATQLRSGVAAGNVTAQPWFENVLAPGQTNSIAAGNSASFIEGDLSSLWLQVNQRRIALGQVPLSNTQIQTLWARGDGGESEYNAFFAILQKRISGGLSFTTSYTLSKAEDQAGVRQNSVTAQSSGFDPNIDWGPASFDRRHVLNVTGVYDLPFGYNSDSSWRWLTGGWYVAGVFSASSGVPLDFCQRAGVFGGGLVFGGCVGAIPASDADFEAGEFGSAGSGNVGTSADPARNGTGLNMWEDPEAVFSSFRRVLVSQDTRAGRGTLRGLPRWNLDMSFGKRTRLPGNVSAVFTAEIINLFNTVQFNNGTLNMATPANFGVIVSQGNVPRTVQFGFRVEF